VGTPRILEIPWQRFTAKNCSVYELRILNCAVQLNFHKDQKTTDQIAKLENARLGNGETDTF